jgi:hypothetical protein
MIIRFSSVKIVLQVGSGSTKICHCEEERRSNRVAMCWRKCINVVHIDEIATLSLAMTNW